jgi:hypothetical protein
LYHPKTNRMKHLFLFVLALCLTQVSYSQNEYNSSWDSDFSQFNYLPIPYTPTLNVNKITFEEIDINKNKVKKHVKYYNNKRKVVSYLLINDKNDTLVLGIQEYTAEGKIKSGQKFKKNVLVASSKSDYDDNGRITKWMKTKGNRKVVACNTWKWNEKGYMTESVLYKRDTTKIKYRWVYDYTDDKRSMSTLYDNKGKVVKIWSYQCNQEGEKLEKKEKVTQICKWNKIDDKYLIKTWRSFDEKGKIKKDVYKYNATDSTIIEHRTYNEKDSLIYICTYNNSWEKPLTVTSFDKKGNKSYEQATTYENNRKVSYSFFLSKKKGMKKVMKVDYSYDNQGMLAEERYFDSKGIHYKTIKLTYEL